MITKITYYLIFIKLLLPMSSFADFDTTYVLEEVLLSIKDSVIEADKVLEDIIDDIQTGNGFTILKAQRNIWIKFDGDSIKLLSEIVDLPKDIDWFQKITIKNNLLYVSVGSYSDSQKDKEDSSVLGAYRAGPKPKGILIIDIKNKKCIEIPLLRVDQSNREDLKGGYPEDFFCFPDTIVPSFTSYIWQGTKFIAGSFGKLMEIDFDKRISKLIELDLELELSRNAMTMHNGTFWISLNEGGAAGSWLKLIKDGNNKEIRIPQYSLSNIDAFGIYSNKLFCSSLAGLIEINENKNKFICYRFSKKDNENHIFGLKLIDGIIFAESKNGLLMILPDTKMAKRLRFKDTSKSNDIYSIGKTGDDLFIGSKSGLFQTKIKW